jgi:hypothetical protein
MANYLDKEQEDIDLALALSLSVQSQQDIAFFTDNDIMIRNREADNMNGRTGGSNSSMLSRLLKPNECIPTRSNPSQNNMATRVSTGQTSTFRSTGQRNDPINVQRQKPPKQQPSSTSHMASRINTNQTSTFKPTGQNDKQGIAPIDMQRQVKVQQKPPIQQPSATSQAPRQIQPTCSSNIPSSTPQSLPYQLANQLYNKVRDTSVSLVICCKLNFAY